MILDLHNGSGATAAAAPTAGIYGEISTYPFVAPFPTLTCPNRAPLASPPIQDPRRCPPRSPSRRGRYAVLGAGPGGHRDGPPAPAGQWHMRWEEADKVVLGGVVGASPHPASVLQGARPSPFGVASCLGCGAPLHNDEEAPLPSHHHHSPPTTWLLSFCDYVSMRSDIRQLNFQSW
jgi:hypothetical protein